MEIVFVELTKDNLLSFRIENEVGALNNADFLFKAKTMQSYMKNAWTVIANNADSLKIVPFKWVGAKNLFFEFASEEDSARLIEFKNNIYVTTSVLSLNLEYVAMGAGIFIELNKEESSSLSYLWKMKTEERTVLQKELEEIFGEGYSLKQDESSKFPYFSWPLFTQIIQQGGYDYIRPKLKLAIENHDLNAIFSFLHGLIIAGYASVKFQGIVFQIPTVKGLYLNKDIILEVFEYLRRYFVFSISEEQCTQISSKDGLFEEMMLMYAKNLKIKADKAMCFLDEDERNQKRNESNKFEVKEVSLWHKYKKNLETQTQLFKFLLDELTLENTDFVKELQLRKIKIHTK